VQVAARARRHDLSAAVVLVDLDNFKEVNDVHGYIGNSNHFFHLVRLYHRTEK